MLIEPNEWVFFAGRAAILVVAMLAFTFALTRWRRAGVRDMQRLFVELDESRGHAQALTDMTQQLTRQLSSLEARLDDRLALAAASLGGQQRGYDLALQMARNGAAVEEIVSASGVTRHEASLLARLHNPRGN